MAKTALCSSMKTETNVRNSNDDDDDDDTPKYYAARQFDEKFLADMSDNRPGKVLETEEQLEIKARILREMEEGTRRYKNQDILEDYGQLVQDEEVEYDSDDPNALDSEKLGEWTIQDLRKKLEYEWDPLTDPDPNKLAMNQEGARYYQPPTKEGQEDWKGDFVTEDDILYDPIFGPYNPIDERTLLGNRDSYMIDERTRDEAQLTPQFDPGDVEIDFNEDIVQFRKSLDILDTYIDPFLPEDLPVPRHVAKWYGYPEQTHFEPKNFTNNRFTENPTDFDSMTPYQARRTAVEMARAKNAEWLPDGVSQAWHAKQREPYEKYGTLVGTLRKGDCDPEIVELIQPALQILGSCADLLSIQVVDIPTTTRLSTLSSQSKSMTTAETETEEEEKGDSSGIRMVDEDDDDEDEDLLLLDDDESSLDRENGGGDTKLMAVKAEEARESSASLLASSAAAASDGDGDTVMHMQQQYIFRFHYHGLIKNRYGMQCWTEKLIAECGVDVSSVIFETGFRKRDVAYEGGDPYNGPLYW